jgi:hypothetical protein
VDVDVDADADEDANMPPLLGCAIESCRLKILIKGR